MFPRHIHQFLDGNYVPESLANCVRSWQTNNPGFQYTLWSSEAASRLIEENFGSALSASFGGCTDPVLKCRLFRNVVLLVAGGVSVDMNTECLGPIEPLLQPDCEAVVGRLSALEAGASGDAGEIEFLAARPGAQLLGRMLADLNSNAASTGTCRSAWESSDLLDMGIATSTVTKLAPSLLAQFVTPQHLPRIAPPPVSGSDSLKQQEIGAARRTLRWCGYLFLGHPRCGSFALSAMLSAAGLRVGYEGPGPDGSVTWWQTAKRVPGVNWPSFWYGKSQNRQIWIAGRILHYLRDPREAIPSIVLENEFNGRQNNSFRTRRRVLDSRFDIDIGKLDAPAAAATSYALWNRIAEEAATDGPIFVEKPSLEKILPQLGPIPHRRRNDSVRKFGVQKPDIDVGDAIRRSPSEAQPTLQRYLSIYADLTGNTPA